MHAFKATETYSLYRTGLDLRNIRDLLTTRESYYEFSSCIFSDKSVEISSSFSGSSS